MIFTIDEQTSRLITKLPDGEGVKEYDCVTDTCRNPACRCQTVTISFRARRSVVPAQPEPERKVALDLGTRTVDDTFRKGASQPDIAFAEALLAAMEPADFELLDRLHFSIKRRETEQAKPAEILAQFDFDEIERSSIMQAYNDILPFAETMQVVVDGIEYVVLDQYCVKPGCGCSDVHLNLLPIEEGAGVLETSCSVNANYGAKTWQQVEDEPLPCDVATFRRLMESNVPNFYTKLKARHKKLSSIYTNARKRARASIADGIRQEQVGRNDPCPCGSGRKFKKCCMGKAPRGADARRSETTISIRQ